MIGAGQILVVFISLSAAAIFAWIVFGTFRRRSKTRSETAVAQSVNSDLVQVAATQQMLEKLRKTSLHYKDRVTTTKRATLALRKANPELLMKALKRGHDEANLMRLPEPKLIWPGEIKLPPADDAMKPTTVGNDSSRALQIPDTLAPIRISFIFVRCIAVVFAFYAVVNHPYSFYVLTRWVIFLTCCWGVGISLGHFWQSFAPAYIAMGLAFNPLLPLFLQRSTWHVLDIGAGIIFGCAVTVDLVRHVYLRRTRLGNAPRE